MPKVNLDQSFFHVEVGDRVTRLLGGSIPMLLEVEKVDMHHIYTKGGWVFMRHNGAEIDPDIGWDANTKTGSYLVEWPKH